MRRPDRRRLRRIYERLLACYGPQHWWPAASSFEVMVGAILTQNTAWSNVERAIQNLRALIALTPEALMALPAGRLAQAIRPAGYFNLKAGRLRHYCRWYLDHGGQRALARWDTADLRQGLLSVHGIGPETADDILLYAFHRPVFVIDAYTRRVFGRLGLVAGDAPYETLRRSLENALGPEVGMFNEYHALIVRHAKEACDGRRPRCGACCLRRSCWFRLGNRE